MSRLILLALLTATLAACSQAGPYGYGYAVNGRPSLSQLTAVPDDSDNSFRTGAQTASAAAVK
jgi:predicted small lipoprotein YifL